MWAYTAENINRFETNHDWLELSRIRMTHPGFGPLGVSNWESIRAVARNRLTRESDRRDSVYNGV
jgi:hypothetical protein